MHSIGAQISSIYPVRKDERTFQKGCGLFTDLSFSDLTIGKTGRKQHLSQSPAATLPTQNQWCFGSQGGSFTGVKWWMMVILLEGV